VTSHDVASAAGVSQATVARTFSSPDLVAPATKLRVEEAAALLAYIPNAMARTLKSQRSRIIGVVVPSQGEYYQHVLTELTRQLSAAGQQLLMFTFSGADDIDGVITSVLSYQVDGVMLASSAISIQQTQRIVSSEVHVVSFNQPAAAGLSPSVVPDNAAGAPIHTRPGSMRQPISSRKADSRTQSWGPATRSLLESLTACVAPGSPSPTTSPSPDSTGSPRRNGGHTTSRLIPNR